MTDIIPDYVVPTIGWRIWMFRDYLGSLNSNVPQQPLQRMEAVCHALMNHEVPDKNCTCGIYAVPTLQAAVRELAARAGIIPSQIAYLARLGSGYAIGQVYLWGKVIEHQTGYRAQFAYPKTIMTASRSETERLLKLYQCEEETTCKWENLYESTESNLWASPQVIYARITSQWYPPPPPPTRNGQMQRRSQSPPYLNEDEDKQQQKAKRAQK